MDAGAHGPILRGNRGVPNENNQNRGLDQISFALPQRRNLRALPETQLLLRRRWLLSKGPGSNVSGVHRDVALEQLGDVRRNPARSEPTNKQTSGCGRGVTARDIRKSYLNAVAG